MNKEKLLKYINEEIDSCNKSTEYLSKYAIARVIDNSGKDAIDVIVKIEKSKDNKKILEHLKFKIEGCEFDN